MNINYAEAFSNYPEILNAKMIAEILGIGYIKSLKLIKYSDMKYIKIGNVYRVPKKCFVEWLHSDESKVINLEA
ncbi:MerR family transcriptional regulator [Geosporobacter ferrireducens]|uniref:Helix-turn-helix domain-containing protein n=1 Tax=Geosporobacter ferrireducens TaxID=1424294 RepID=A0A1D8GPJ6_9FIRM|nr:hypothetical protein [Geosporobacter ferrireducens]AOT72807.1 hypothetical protein Gferi_26560 [Geosporobacter ferrireducens]